MDAAPLRRRAMRMGTLAAAAVSMAKATWPCNGSPYYCELPLDQYTFAGAHNAGAHDLSAPSKYFLQTPGITTCYFQNHNQGIKGMLEAGMRFFSFDLCRRSSEPTKIYSVHAMNGDEAFQAYGESWDTTLKIIKYWLIMNPREIVMIRHEDMWPNEIQDGPTEAHMQDVFGSCADMNMSAPVSDDVSPRCMYWGAYPPDPEAMTLGRLIDTRRRLIYVKEQKDTSAEIEQTWFGGYGGITNKGLADRFVQVARDLSNRTKRYNPQVRVHQILFAVFRGIVAPDFSNGAVSFGNLACNSYIAQFTNDEFFPPNSYPINLTADFSQCDSECLGYRSPTEVAHQYVLDRGYSVTAVILDYEEYGDFVATVHRMNEANLRRFWGQPEPSKPPVVWTMPAWLQAILAVGILFVIFVAVGLVLRRKPHWVPGCVRRCLKCYAPEPKQHLAKSGAKSGPKAQQAMYPPQQLGQWQQQPQQWQQQPQWQPQGLEQGFPQQGFPQQGFQEQGFQQQGFQQPGFQQQGFQQQGFPQQGFQQQGFPQQGFQQQGDFGMMSPEVNSVAPWPAAPVPGQSFGNNNARWPAAPPPSSQPMALGSPTFAGTPAGFGGQKVFDKE